MERRAGDCRRLRPSREPDIVTPAAISTASSRRTEPSPVARVGQGLWRLLTSVDFAVAQIIVIVLLAIVGMTIKQLPDFAFRSASDYTLAMDQTHARYDALLGADLVTLLERLSAFQMFRSVWFSAALSLLVASIVVCTLDRTPRLWRGVAEVRVAQPEPYFDPILPDRAAMTGVAETDLRAVLRGNGFRVREAADADGRRFLYGDRNQYTKMATLFTHLGLILFLVAAAVTSRTGDELGLVIAEGESQTVQSIGTPGLLLVKNLGFLAPGLETGQASDFTTDLAVYRDGEQIARKTIRVNDPLSVGGYTFHQNGFGPAPHLVIRDRAGLPLWDAAYPLTDAVEGRPYGVLSVPGRDIGLQMLLTKQGDGTGIVLLQPYRAIGASPDGSPIVENLLPVALAIGETRASDQMGITVELTGVEQYTLLIAKNDPGQGLVWLAFVSLILGIVITFYFPRRRVWTRLDPAGRLGIVWRSDRYVDVEREFGRLLDDLVAVRRST